MIKGKVVPVKSLTGTQMRDMFVIMQKYYENIEWGNFFKDLNGKLDALLLCDTDDNIKGFTTLAVFRLAERCSFYFPVIQS